MVPGGSSGGGGGAANSKKKKGKKKGGSGGGGGGGGGRPQVIDGFMLLQGSRNILQGLRLHTHVMTPKTEATMVRWVDQKLDEGRRKQLRGSTFMAPSRWMKGKGREILQFGVFYDYQAHEIAWERPVEPMPPVLVDLVDKLVAKRVLPEAVRPDTCIVNVYNPGDCIPPHIDHESYPRPFCTVSLLSEADILFGTAIRVAGDGEFDAPFGLRLPRASCLVIDGNAANTAQHCIPSVPERRISITFRKAPARGRR